MFYQLMERLKLALSNTVEAVLEMDPEVFVASSSLERNRKITSLKQT